MPFVAGIDSSTQSTKVEIRDLDTGRVRRTGSSPHPLVTPPVSEQEPGDWWSAFELAYAQAVAASGAGRRPAPIAAISVGGQQHGMVAVDRDDQPVHPAKLWNDTESAPDAEWLIQQMGGGDAGSPGVRRRGRQRAGGVVHGHEAVVAASHAPDGVGNAWRG